MIAFDAITCRVIALIQLLLLAAHSLHAFSPVSTHKHPTATLKGLESCTDWERVYQAGWFTALNDHLSNYASCPKDQWLDGYQALHPGGKRVLIDIGCNKGYTSAQFFAMWQPQRGFNPNHLFHFYNNTGRWGTAHQGQAKGYIKLCGNCLDCEQQANPNITEHTADIEVHCIEPSSHFHSMLTAAHEHFFRRDQLTPHASHGQWFIHKTIVSNVSGVDLPFPSDCDEEWSCTVHNVDHRASKVPSTTVDAFVASRNIKWVDVLKIDAEGFDPAVLSGAVQLLDNKAVGVLVFEYHSQGLWQQTRLQHVVSWLHGFGYGCFFDVNGHEEDLVQLTGCWSAPLEIRAWSNIVCAAEGSSMLTYLAQHSLLQRERVRTRKRHHEAFETVA